MKVKRRRTTVQNEALAYHEAGHVVAIWQLKGPEAVGYVTIEPDTFSERHAHDKFCPDEKEFCKEGESDLYGRLSFELEKEIVTLLAGEAAQRRFKPHSIRRRQGMTDWANAASLIRYVTPYESENKAYLKWLTEWAKEFVKYHWPMIEDLATELLRQPTINGRELQAWFRHWTDNESDKARIESWQNDLQREEKRRSGDALRKALAQAKK